MSTDDLLVARHARSNESSPTASSTTPLPPPVAPAPSSSFDRLRNTFRRTESMSSQIFSHISTQFTNAAAAAAASEVIDGTTPYPSSEEPTTPTAPPTAAPAPPEASASPSPSKIISKRAKRARDTAEIERSNLVNICKLVVKELLEQSLRYGRMLDSDHLPLQHFFIVIEHVLGHGLRPKKGLLGPRKELWDLLQSVEHYCPEAQDITASVRDLPTVRTHIGRARAWLRIALMQKKLSDYLQALIEHRDDSLYDYYEPHALMMSDEIVVIMGILVGLNVIDCNLCVKEEDLDSQQGVIDFSLYLRSSSRSPDAPDDSAPAPAVLDATGQGNMIAVLDQKNYIEELNRHLNATVGNLQAKVESLTTTNALMKEDLAIARNSLLALQAENQAMRQSSQTQQQQQQQKDSDNSSGSGSDKEKSEAVSTDLSEERRKNGELEKELKLQVSLKAESDMAMKLLEKDIHEKQDTIVSLRRQLDDIKQINLEMYRKLQKRSTSRS
ncbi:protein RUFY3 isoform X5 [Drosophila obscura]|uniref:protein RUFY3 isoform X5 n=1 Tax=Drosophila obscura TaxID=7282 RepID=UPI001BB0FFB2|nr:protein RUFY3 isoform X5 [Drosophila obscura]